MEKLFTEYGKLMVQKEILDNQIARVKQAIVTEGNKPQPEPEVKKDVKDDSKK